MEENLMTVKEVAEYLNVSPLTLMKWIEKDQLNCPVYRLNGKNSYRFKRSEVKNIITTKGHDYENEKINA